MDLISGSEATILPFALTAGTKGSSHTSQSAVHVVMIRSCHISQTRKAKGNLVLRGSLLIDLTRPGSLLAC